METDDAADFRQFVARLVREQQEHVTWDPVHWRTTLAVIAATLLPDTSISDYLRSQGAELSTKLLLSVVKRGNTRLLRLTIDTLRKFRRWTPADWHCGIALTETWCSKDMYGIMVANGVVFRAEWLVPAVRCRDTGTILTIIHGLKSIGLWKPAGAEVQRSLEESITDQQSACFYCLLSEGAIAAARSLVLAVATGNQDMVMELVRNLKAWSRATWKVDKNVIEALEKTCAKGDLVMYSLLVNEGVEPTYQCLLSAMRLCDIDVGSRVASDLHRRGRRRPTHENSSYIAKFNADLDGMPTEGRAAWVDMLRGFDSRICNAVVGKRQRYTDGIVNDGPRPVSDNTSRVKSPMTVRFLNYDGQQENRDAKRNANRVAVSDMGVDATLNREITGDGVTMRSKVSASRYNVKAKCDVSTRSKVLTTSGYEAKKRDDVTEGSTVSTTSRYEVTTEPTMTSTPRYDVESMDGMALQPNLTTDNYQRDETTSTPPNSPMAAAYELPPDDLVRRLSEEECREFEQCIVKENLAKEEDKATEWNVKGQENVTKSDRDKLSRQDIPHRVVNDKTKDTTVEIKITHADDTEECYNASRNSERQTTLVTGSCGQERSDATKDPMGITVTGTYGQERSDATKAPMGITVPKTIILTNGANDGAKPKITIARSRTHEGNNTTTSASVANGADSTDTENAYSTAKRKLQEIFQPRTSSLPLIQLCYGLGETDAWNEGQECDAVKSLDMFYLKRRFLFGMKRSLTKAKYGDHLSALKYM